jgi:cold shock CspA family protein
MNAADSKLTRIGVFYDGNFFFHVSNYYQYHHERRSRISVGGLHAFIRDEVARCEGSEQRYCQIVDAHYFRGRLRAAEAETRDVLYKERVFEDVLMREGVTTHYLPLGPAGEKGIDVWLALEAYELSIHKRFNVSVLIVSDGDYLPLIRKLTTIGTRVMVLGWDFKYVDQNGSERETRTAQSLLDEASYPEMMHQVIDDRARRNDPLVNGLFVPRKEPINGSYSAPTRFVSTGAAERTVGILKRIKDGYGFITPDRGGGDVFFSYADVVGIDFLELKAGDEVEFTMGRNDKGACAKEVQRL